MNKTFVVDLDAGTTLKEILDALPDGCDPAQYTVAVRDGGDDSSYELEIVGPNPESAKPRFAVGDQFQIQRDDRPRLSDYTEPRNGIYMVRALTVPAVFYLVEDERGGLWTFRCGQIDRIAKDVTS